MSKKFFISLFTCFNLIHCLAFAKTKKIKLSKNKVAVVKPVYKNLPIMILPDNPETPIISHETSQKLLPKSIKPDESGTKVLNQIADNSLAWAWDNSQFKNTTVGRAAETVEKKMKVEAAVETADQVEHKFSFKILAAQTLAKLEYTGWLKAAVNYDARASMTQAEIVEAISSHQDFVLSHAINPQENKSAFSYRFNW